MSKLGLTEFRQVFFDNLDSYVVTNFSHIEENTDFYEEVVLKLFDFYQRPENSFNVRDLVTPFHIFLYAMFKHKPSTDKNDEEIVII